MQNVRSAVTYECTHCTLGESCASAWLDVAAALDSSRSLSRPTPSIMRSMTNFFMNFASEHGLGLAFGVDRMAVVLAAHVFENLPAAVATEGVLALPGLRQHVR